MSQDQLAAFLSELSSSPGLQEELRSVTGGHGEAAEVAPEDLVRFAASKGHDFTVREVQSAFEMSDEELDSVSGGRSLAEYAKTTKNLADVQHGQWLRPLSFDSLISNPSWKK